MKILHKNQSTMNHKQSTVLGFTLIELLVVIAIIGVLATIMMLQYGAVQSRARDTQRIRDLDNIKYALILYEQENGNIPYNGTACNFGDTSCLTSLSSKLIPKYIQSIPTGPSYKGWTYVLYGECITTERNQGCEVVGPTGEDATGAGYSVRPAFLETRMENTSLRGNFLEGPSCSSFSYCLTIAK